jgi:diguanylate cyclase (GGDEF)-like protein
MSTPLRLLIVEDSEDDALLLLRELRQGGFDPRWQRIDTADALVSALEREQWDLVIADFSIPGFSGTEALELLRARDGDLPFIFVSGTIGEEVAVAAMKAGAHDYVMKGNMRRLVPAIERELRDADMRREHRRIAARVQHLAYHDVLTDLPNRALLHDRLLQALAMAQREHESLALLILDLDGFKYINDTLGHRVGDALLQELGRRLLKVIRDADTVARLGGDEFAVLLLGAGEDSVQRVARRLLTAIEQPFHADQLELTVRASLGVAFYPTHGDSADMLLQRADIAMHTAKESGNGMATYVPDMDRHRQQRLMLGSELNQALQSQQLMFQFQPKVRLADRTVVGMELLTYWQHPREGLLPPSRFIGLAEETGLIRPLTLTVIDAALRAAQQWHVAGQHLVVAVNLSPRTLEDDRFPDEVAMLVQTAGLPPAALELEITENLIISDPGRAMAILTRWNKAGIRLSIDDFGTGYSSLAYLKRLPVHEIKIDRSFIIDLARHGDEMIVRSTIDLAHNLGLTVVAEGVETEATWDRLVTLGCDAAQGFYASPPAPLPEISAWLEGWRSTPGATAFSRA